MYIEIANTQQCGYLLRLNYVLNMPNCYWNHFIFRWARFIFIVAHFPWDKRINERKLRVDIHGPYWDKYVCVSDACAPLYVCVWSNPFRIYINCRRLAVVGWPHAFSWPCKSLFAFAFAAGLDYWTTRVQRRLAYKRISIYVVRTAHISRLRMSASSPLKTVERFKFMLKPSRTVHLFGRCFIVTAAAAAHIFLSLFSRTCSTCIALVSFCLN